MPGEKTISSGIFLLKNDSFITPLARKPQTFPNLRLSLPINQTNIEKSRKWSFFLLAI